MFDRPYSESSRENIAKRFRLLSVAFSEAWIVRSLNKKTMKEVTYNAVESDTSALQIKRERERDLVRSTLNVSCREHERAGIFMRLIVQPIRRDEFILPGRLSRAHNGVQMALFLNRIHHKCDD